MSRHSCTPVAGVLMMLPLVRPLYLSVDRGPVSLSPGFPGGIRFWADPPLPGPAPDRLLPHGETPGGLLRSRGPFHTVGRVVLFAEACVGNGYRPSF